MLNITSYELLSNTYANALFNYSVLSISLVNLKKLIFKSSLEKASTKSCGYCCLVSLIPQIFPDPEMRHLRLFSVKVNSPLMPLYTLASLFLRPMLRSVEVT